MAETIGVLGSGSVGEALANGFLRHGWEVMRGSRDPGKLDAWKRTAGAGALTGSFLETARFGNVVVLAVKGMAAESVVRTTADHLAGKIVLDATNPIAETPPTAGVLHYFTSLEESLMERLQRLAPAAHFVKAFSCVGAALMVNPELPGGKPTMFIAGNQGDAKEKTRGMLTAFGWETEDLGSAEAARAIEPLAMLWCIPGFLRNDWMHAYRVLRK